MSDQSKPGSFQLPYAGKYKRVSAFDFPRFALTKKDEKGIIMLMDPQPTCAFVHWVVTGIRLDNKTQVKTTKGGYFICLGAPDKLLKDEADPEHCPYCAHAEDIDGAPVGSARFKACTHLIHYGTTPGGTLANPPGYPPQFLLKVWVFGQQMYNGLTDKRELWGDDTFRLHDLMVTCVSSQYQNYQIDVMPKSIWLEPQWTQYDPQTKKPVNGLAIQIAQLYQQTRLKDLTPLLGKLTSVEEAGKFCAAAKTYVEQLGGADAAAGMTPADVEAAVNAHGAAGPAGAAAVNIDDLFGQPASPPPPAQPVQQPPAVTQTPPSVPQQPQATFQAEVTVAETAPQSAPPPPPAPAQNGGAVDFDSLLG